MNKKTHKAINFEEHCKDISVQIETKCHIQNKTWSYWWSAHWEDVDCQQCLWKKEVRRNRRNKSLTNKETVG